MPYEYTYGYDVGPGEGVPEFGAELLLNGTFDTGTDDWSISGSTTWVAGAVQAGSGGGDLIQSPVVNNGSTYRLTYDLSVVSGSGGALAISSQSFSETTKVLTVGVGQTWDMLCTDSTKPLRLAVAIAGTVFEIDNLSLKKVN